MKRRRISIDEIRNVLSPVFKHYQDKVIFAYLFGSMVQETPYPAKDIDIAVSFQKGSLESYIDSRLSLYADICRALKTNDVDLVILNTTTKSRGTPSLPLSIDRHLHIPCRNDHQA